MTISRPQPEPEDEHLASPDRPGAIRRRFLARGPTPEERLAQFVEERRREFDEQTARFERTLAELEERERSLSDARASIERLLRLGAKDLDVREADITRVMDTLSDREARLHEEEAELAERRSELGAVELKRLVVEQRERSLEAREARLAAEDERSAGREPSERTDTAMVAFVPGPTYRVVEIDAADVAADRSIAIEGETYEVIRTGPSPLPGDRRRCLYLVRGPRGRDSSAGSS